MGEGNYLELVGREVTGGGGREEVTGEGKWERITSRFRGQAK